MSRWTPPEVEIIPEETFGRHYLARSAAGPMVRYGSGRTPFDALADLLASIDGPPRRGCNVVGVSGHCGCCETAAGADVVRAMGAEWQCAACGAELRSQCGRCLTWFPMPSWNWCPACAASPTASAAPPGHYGSLAFVERKAG